MLCGKGPECEGRQLSDDAPAYNLLTRSVLFSRWSLILDHAAMTPIQYLDPNSTFANKEKVWKVSSPVFPRSAEQLETQTFSFLGASSTLAVRRCHRLAHAPSLPGCLQLSA